MPIATASGYGRRFMAVNFAQVERLWLVMRMSAVVELGELDRRKDANPTSVIRPSQFQRSP